VEIAMNLPPLFPEMVDTTGALLPALISVGIILAGRARSGLGAADQFWLVVLSLALTAVLARVVVTPEVTSLHIVPGATLIVCYLVWCGFYISPGLAFALTYATSLPVDFFLAQMVTGADFNIAAIGGAGWRDGLLLLPALTALAVMYANWRIASVGRARLLWFGQHRGGWATEAAGRQAPNQPGRQPLISH
jgi:hypothetical protein